MPKLYLVGVTEDRSGLILSKSARAKSGDSVLEVDAAVLEAVAEVRRFRSTAGASRLSSPALPSRRGDVSGPQSSRLSPREIQDRLRHGESVKSVARRAGLDEWRVEVYAAPVLAEQARMVGEAQRAVLSKRGAGPSGVGLGDAVRANVAVKQAGMTTGEYDAGWSAHETTDGQWKVRFSYVSRGREQVAEWIYEPESKTITAANRLATALGWRDPKARGRLPKLADGPAPSAAKKSPAKKTTRKKATPKKTTRKKAPAKRPSPKPAPRKKATPKKATPKKATPKKATPKKTTRKKSPARKSPPKRPAARPRSTPRAPRRRFEAESPPASNGGTQRAAATPRFDDALPQPPSWHSQPSVRAERAVDRPPAFAPAAPPPSNGTTSANGGHASPARRRRVPRLRRSR
ncbi:MAG TPA: septation protein SepH [Acidimicrobiia bacterium]|nr:septation protein SepH [Acidimicrobiia bacterium]